MKISYHFDTLKDLSSLSKGEKLLEIFEKNDFIIEKANECEPIRDIFNIEDFPKLWLSGKSPEEFAYQTLLFKGSKEISFKCMVSWSVNMHKNSQAVNGVSVWLNIKKNYLNNNIDKLIKLGDDLFIWSESMYGYISQDIYDPNYGINKHQRDKCKYPEYIRMRLGRESKNKKHYIMLLGISYGIKDPAWINYFGTPYLQEPDFNVPKDHIKVGHGVRFQIAERPDDEILCEPDFLADIKRGIGDQWFWQNPKICDLKLPKFDRSEITRVEVDQSL